MLERQLTDELHRVGDQLEVPPDLFPTRRIALAARPWWRRPIAASVAAAVFLALLLGLTPAGQRTVLAATDTATSTVRQWLSQRGLVFRLTRNDKTLVLVPPDGSKPVMLRNGRDVFWVAERTLTVAELKQQEPRFQVPAYLGPVDSDHVKIMTVQDMMHLYLSYNVPGQGQITLQFSQTDGNAPEAAPAAAAGTQAVQVGGRPATAFTNGVHWIITWDVPSGLMELSGNLPLEELLKVAESIPDPTP